MLNVTSETLNVPKFTSALPSPAEEFVIVPLPPMMVSEETAAYNADSRQGTYTIRDYYVLSEDRRMELIDGYIYDMASPTKIHQFILSQIYLQLAPCVDAHPGCMSYFAPLDVRLDNDDYTIVQPDLMILCDSADHDIRRVNGAPDFVIEILSASSRFHDMFRKLYKYKSAGVREYWIIDPEKKRVTVYDFELGGDAGGTGSAGITRIAGGTGCARFTGIAVPSVFTVLSVLAIVDILYAALAESYGITHDLAVLFDF